METLSSLQQRSVPIRRAVRRVRWFLASFREHLAGVTARIDRDFRVDEARLTAAFVSWLRAFEAQKHKASDHRVEYVTFAAGLMLRELIHHEPLSARPRQDFVDFERVENFWPEGYVYVTYCLAVRDAVLEQDFSTRAGTHPFLRDLRTWWSFRENMGEDDNLAIGFLTLFSGEAPDWELPGVFAPKSATGPALALRS